MILLALGTRPEVIKFFPIVRALKKKGMEFKVLFTGQHYDRLMCDVFFEYFNYIPDINLELKTSLLQDIKQKAKETLKELSPSLVVVLGDTNSTLAIAEASKELSLPVAHIEAGLRSYDLRMPEENNRIKTDRISDYLFAPTSIAAENLKRERVKGRIEITGNPIVDAVEHVKPSLKGETKKKLGLGEEYAILTAHREENLVVYERLNPILRIAERLAEHMDVVVPVHPKLKLRMEQLHLSLRKEGILLTEPLPYFDLLDLLKDASLVVTDSGGIQEEARTFKRPVITLRETTERVETLLEGNNALVGNNPVMFNFYLKLFLNGSWPPHGFPKENPFGDGKAGERIASLLSEITR